MFYLNTIPLIISFACYGIVQSMMMLEVFNNEILSVKKNGKVIYEIKMPKLLTCNKCVAFWYCLAYCLYLNYGIASLGIAATASLLSIAIFKRL